MRKTGHAYTPKETQDYEAMLRSIAAEQMNGREPFHGPVAVEVIAYMAIPSSWSAKKRAAAVMGLLLPTVKPDWENIAKTLDGLNGIVWDDDRQVVRGFVSKKYSDRPRLWVKCEE